MMTNKDILIHAVAGRFIKFGATSFSALLVILIFISFRPLVAQGQKVDSLKSLLEKEFGPKRQQINFELAYHFTDIDNRLAALVSHDIGTINASNYLAKIEETSNNLIRGLSRVHDQQV
jgi:hypothetical protein